MVTSEILDLSGLRIDNVGCVLEMVVDDLLVAGVDEWAKVDEGDGNEGKSPDWSEFDQPVRDKRCNKGGNSMSWLFGKQNSLELDDEKVNELLDIFQGCFEGLSWNGVVLPWSEGGCQSLGQDHLAAEFCSCSASEYDIEHLECPPQCGQVAGGEDEQDSRQEGDGGSAGVFPA